MSETAALTYFTENMERMRSVAAHDCDVSDEIRKMLYDRTLLEQAKSQLNKLKKFQELQKLLQIETTTLGQSFEIWIEFFDNFYVDSADDYKARIFTKAAILSNILNPKLKGKCLSSQIVANAKITMMQILRSKDDFKVFCNYLKDEDLFQNECLKEQDSEIVWMAVEEIAPKLSAFAQVSFFKISHIHL